MLTGGQDGANAGRAPLQAGTGRDQSIRLLYHLTTPIVQRRGEANPAWIVVVEKDSRLEVADILRLDAERLKKSQEFVDRVFNGAGRPLVVHLLEDEQLTEADLREIGRLRGKKK